MRKRSKKRVFVLDDRHKLAVQIFAQGDFVTMQEVASRVGVCRQTLWRWWQIPAFRRYYEGARRAAVAKNMPEYRAKMREMIRPIKQQMREVERQDLREMQRRWIAEYNAREKTFKELKP